MRPLDIVALGVVNASTGDARRIEGALSRAGTLDYRITLVPGADHAIQVPRTTRAPEWRRPVAGWEMVAWVTTRVRQ